VLAVVCAVVSAAPFILEAISAETADATARVVLKSRALLTSPNVLWLSAEEVPPFIADWLAIDGSRWPFLARAKDRRDQ